MTRYSNQQSMVFNLLAHIDYSQTWAEIEYGLGYDLGDYNFGNKDSECRQIILDSARHLWASFNGKINTHGNLI